MIVPVFGERSEFQGIIEMDAEVFVNVLQFNQILALDGGSDSPEIFETFVTSEGFAYLRNHAEEAEFLEKVRDNLHRGSQPFVKRVQVFK